MLEKVSICLSQRTEKKANLNLITEDDSIFFEAKILN